MKKKLSLVFVTILLFGLIGFTSAIQKIPYEKIEDIAKQYIENSIDDFYWKNNNPYISDKTFFYTDNDNAPSYIEFKISCDNTKDCGFIIVNIDGDDVAVPIASPNGVGPSELLMINAGVDKLSINKNDYKIYYFSPFQQYAQNFNTNEVVGIDPTENLSYQLESYLLNERINIKESLDKNFKIEKNSIFSEINNKEINFESLIEDYEKEQEIFSKLDSIKIDNSKIESKKTEIKKSLINKLEEFKNIVKEFKKSIDFNEQKKSIDSQILKISNEKYSMNILNMTNAEYSAPVGPSNKFVNGNWAPNNSNCQGKTPCYRQDFNAVYNRKTCNVAGCGPTAVGIIFGYYSNITNNGINLFPNGNPGWTNNSNVEAVIKYIGGLMNTNCDKDVRTSSTKKYNMKYAIGWPRALGYSANAIYSGDELGNYVTFYNVYDALKSEVNQNRPLLIGANLISNTGISSGHAYVGYGYKLNNSNLIARINTGIGKYPVDGGNTYFYSDIDLNLSSMYMQNNNFKATSYTKFIIN